MLLVWYINCVCLTQGLKLFLSYFLLQLSVLGIYRSVIHFKLIFIYSVRYELRFLVLFIIFVYRCPVLAPFIAKTVHIPFNCLYTFVRNQLYMCGSISVLSILLYWSVYLSFCQHNPILTLWLSLEITWCESSDLMSF